MILSGVETPKYLPQQKLAFLSGTLSESAGWSPSWWAGAETAQHARPTAQLVANSDCRDFFPVERVKCNCILWFGSLLVFKTGPD